MGKKEYRKWPKWCFLPLLSPSHVLLDSVAKLCLPGALYDPVIFGVNVETVMEPCKQTQTIQIWTIHSKLGHKTAFTGNRGKELQQWPKTKKIELWLHWVSASTKSPEQYFPVMNYTRCNLYRVHTTDKQKANDRLFFVFEMFWTLKRGMLFARAIIISSKLSYNNLEWIWFHRPSSAMWFGLGQICTDSWKTEYENVYQNLNIVNIACSVGDCAAVINSITYNRFVLTGLFASS